METSKDRRHFLKLLATGSATALVAGCRETVEQDEVSTFYKDPAPFVQHGTSNLETKLEDMESFITPLEQFFVRNNDVSLDLNIQDYRLDVTGDGIERNLSLTYEDLKALPSRTVFSYLECGGNQRAFFGELMGQNARGTQWRRGAVGMASWTGVPLCEILQMAGIHDTAVAMQLIGLDKNAPEEGFRRPLSVAKAMDPDTLLAYRMNGTILPRDHGFPVRAIVPGWVGSSSIKWLGRIEVSTTEIWSRNNTSSYVLIGDAYPPEGQAAGKVANEQSIKSALALPWPARLRPGRQLLYGYAHSPNGPIQRVRWSIDSGATWQDATLLDPRTRYSWARFEIVWDAPAGESMIITSAIDESGVEQPETIPFNEKGYLFNMRLPHPVTVTA